MSSNGSYRYDYDVDLDELPALESIDGAEELARVRRAEEVERFGEHEVFGFLGDERMVTVA